MRRCLVLLAVSVVIFVAAPAGAQTYSLVSPDGTVYFTNLPTRAYARDINEAAVRYAVPERLIWAVIRAESGFEPRAVSRRGARGLMQLMPETAAILGVRDSFNPRENIHAGARHLRALMERFGYDLPLAIAAYNAGEKPVLAFRGIPPYPETREYVARVLRLYGAPITWELQGSGIQQIVERNGNVVYTNVAPRRLSAAVLQGR